MCGSCTHRGVTRGVWRLVCLVTLSDFRNSVGAAPSCAAGQRCRRRWKRLLRQQLPANCSPIADAAPPLWLVRLLVNVCLQIPECQRLQARVQHGVGAARAPQAVATDVGVFRRQRRRRRTPQQILQSPVGSAVRRRRRTGQMRGLARSRASAVCFCGAAGAAAAASLSQLPAALRRPQR